VIVGDKSKIANPYNAHYLAHIQPQTCKVSSLLDWNSSSVAEVPHDAQARIFLWHQSKTYIPLTSRNKIVL